MGLTLRKPAAGTETRNKLMLGNDRLAVGWCVNEGSGTTLTNLGKGVAGALTWDGTITGGAWGSHASGAARVRIDGPAGDSLRGPDNTSGVDLAYNRGTICVVWEFVDAIGADVPLFTTGRSTLASNLNAARLSATLSNTLVFAVRNSAGALESVTVNIDGGWQTGVVYVAIASWGEGGMSVSINGEAPDTDDTLTEHLRIQDGDAISVGCSYGATTSDLYVYGFYWWDWQLSDWEKDLIFTDFSLPCRPRCTNTDLLWGGGVIPGAPTTTSWSFRLPVAQDQAATVNIRVHLSEDPTFTGGATETKSFASAVATTLATKSFTVSPTGAGAGDVWYWLAEYQQAGAWLPFPCGRGKVTLRKTSGDYKAAVVADSHAWDILDTGESPAVPAISFGTDIETDEDPATVQFAQLRRLWRSVQDICYRDDIDFIIDLGDSLGHYKLADFNKATWTADQNSFFDAHLPIFMAGATFLAVGNHEEEHGFMQAVIDGDLATKSRQMESTIRRKKFFRNPDSGTYTEGGEAEGAPDTPWGGTGGDPWDPGVEWLPQGLTRTEGIDYLNDYVLLTGPAAGDPRTDIILQANNSPFENYFAFKWGDVLYCFLDGARYSMVGDSENSDDRTNGGERTLGPTQKAWVVGVLANTTAKKKVLCIHNMINGVQGSATWGQDTYYARGSGLTITDPEDLWLHELCKQYGVNVVLKGHDHTFNYQKTDTVNYVTAPPLAAPSLFGLSSQARAIAEYGAVGATKGGRRIGCAGYLLLENTDGGRLEVTCRQTANYIYDWSDPDSVAEGLHTLYVGEPQLEFLE